MKKEKKTEKPEEENREVKEDKKKELKPEETQEERIKELIDLLQRTQANFENYRKQQEKRIEEIQSLANKNLILQLLPILDNFELALKNADRSQDFAQGIKLVYSELFNLLENQGLKKIETENQSFNPYFHEALLKIDSDQPENLVLEEFQKGFMLHNQVIRHAKVKISSGHKPKLNDKNKID